MEVDDSRESLQTILRDHPGLLISGLVGFIVVYRLLSLAAWNPQTAAAVLQHSGSATVVLGVALMAAPMIITTALWLAGSAYFYRWARDGSRPGLIPLGFLTLLTVAVGLAIAMLYQLVFMLIIWLGAAIFGRADRNSEDSAVWKTNRRIVVSMFASLGVSLLIISATPWLPRESVKVGDGPPFTAFILSGGTSEHWVVLREDPRQIEFIDPASDRTRMLCDGSSGGALWGPVPELFGARQVANYPDCPS